MKPSGNDGLNAPDLAADRALKAFHDLEGFWHLVRRKAFKTIPSQGD
jgi:hypothetical protein